MKKSSSVTLLGCGDGAKELKFISLDDLAFKEVIGNLADLVNVGAGGGILLALFFRNLTGPSSSEGETAGEGRDGGVLDGVGCLEELSRTCFGEVSLVCIDLGLKLLGSLTSTSFSLIDFLLACCIEVYYFVHSISVVNPEQLLVHNFPYSPTRVTNNLLMTFSLLFLCYLC